jgi:hypothetical protein
LQREEEAKISAAEEARVNEKQMDGRKTQLVESHIYRHSGELCLEEVSLGEVVGDSFIRKMCKPYLALDMNHKFAPLLT